MSNMQNNFAKRVNDLSGAAFPAVGNPEVAS